MFHAVSVQRVAFHAQAQFQAAFAQHQNQRALRGGGGGG